MRVGERRRLLRSARFVFTVACPVAASILLVTTGRNGQLTAFALLGLVLVVSALTAEI
jgi:hypothetical protein